MLLDFVGYEFRYVGRGFCAAGGEAGPVVEVDYRDVAVG